MKLIIIRHEQKMYHIKSTTILDHTHVDNNQFDDPLPFKITYIKYWL